MNKNAVIDQLIKHIQDEIEHASSAAKDAFEYATDQDSKSEGKYDTRSLEASYLAGGQAQKAREWKDAHDEYIQLKTRILLEPPTQQAGLGSLIESRDQQSGESEWFFIGPSAGGFSVDDDGHTITAINLHSPLGMAIASHITGDTIELANGRKLELVQVI